jgi:hypothetical protein
MGLSSKCFEILENRPSNYDLRHEAGHSTVQYAVEDPLLSEDESEATEDDEDEDGFEDAGGGADEESESEAGSEELEDVSEDESSGEEKRPKLRVREILFYEERVEAFRRRHGVLRP